MDEQTSSALRHMAEALEEEALFLSMMKDLPEPDMEIRTRQLWSYYRLLAALRRKAAEVEEKEGRTAP